MVNVPLNKFIPGIAWFFLVNLLCCLPGSELPQAGDWLSRIYFDKWVHTGLFAVLAFLLMYPVFRSDTPGKGRFYYYIRVCIAVSIWGLTIEFIQKYYIVGRSFDIVDWLCDSLGALLAFLFLRWLESRKRG